MLQLLSLLCMEPPVTFDADEVRDEKVKVLHAVEPPPPDAVVRAQYTSGMAEGKEAVGYLEEEDVPPDSQTETYVALRLEVDNWRWAGVPIYLRTGKRLARKVTEIAVTLKPVPHLAFQADGSVGVQPNQIILAMQPNEGVSISLGAKIPGSRMRIRPVNMEFLYGTSFLSQSPEAYERLILDAMRGDATLFTRNDEVEAQWRIIDPILESWEKGDEPLATYPAGSPGPAGGGRDPRPRPSLAGHLAMAPKVVPEVPDEGAVWSAQDTTPGAIEEALRDLLTKQYARDQGHAPARVLNLVVVVDREWRGEIMNRLEQVGRYHASRTILCDVEPGRTTIDASVVLTVEGERQPGVPGAHARARDHRGRAQARAQARHDRRSAGRDRPPDGRLVAARASGGSGRAPSHLAGGADRLRGRARPRERAEACGGAERRRVRGRPRLAADDAVAGAGGVHVRPAALARRALAHRLGQGPPPSGFRGGGDPLLRLACLAAGLGHRLAACRPMARVRGHASARRQNVTLTLEPDPHQDAPGLAGIEIGTSSGMSISLDRGPGGLLARRRDPKGREREWTILGASRGEGGILGEGIRQALLRDPAYRGALDSAEAMLH